MRAGGGRARGHFRKGPPGPHSRQFRYIFRYFRNFAVYPDLSEKGRPRHNGDAFN
jgi:hypothetical protein